METQLVALMTNFNRHSLLLLKLFSDSQLLRCIDVNKLMIAVARQHAGTLPLTQPLEPSVRHVKGFDGHRVASRQNCTY